MNDLSIGQLAKSARVSVDTIRFYEKTGLLRPAARRPSGFRQYSELDLRKLKFIRRGRLIGFSLEEIRQLLALDEDTDAEAASAVIRRTFTAIDRKIEHLNRWRCSLIELAAHGAVGAAPMRCVHGHSEDEFIESASAPSKH